MLDINEYIELTDNIVKEVLSFATVQKYIELKQKIANDFIINQLISEFEQAKLSYEDVEKYGSKYHPDYKAVSGRLIKAKTQLFEHPDIIKFKLYEKEIQTILNQVTLSMKEVIKFDTNKEKKSSCKNGCSH